MTASPNLLHVLTIIGPSGGMGVLRTQCVFAFCHYRSIVHTYVKCMSNVKSMEREGCAKQVHSSKPYYPRWEGEQKHNQDDTDDLRDCKNRRNHEQRNWGRTSSECTSQEEGRHLTDVNVLDHQTPETFWPFTVFQPSDSMRYILVRNVNSHVGLIV